MQILFRKIQFSENVILSDTTIERTSKRKPKKPYFFVAIVVGAALFSILLFAVISNLESLSPERLEKLMGLFKKYDEEAEQYVLVALRNRLYPCPSCPDADSIFLMTDEVWKYGVSVNGENGRYTKSYLTKMNLRYRTEFTGSLTECYKMEKSKIFMYPTLPENLKRGNKKLFRPPGNPTD